MSKKRKQLFMGFTIVYTMAASVFMLNAIASVYYKSISLPQSPVPELNKSQLGAVMAKLDTRTNPVASGSVNLQNYTFGKAEPF